MARKLELEVANFICRFGDKYVLNDLLEEIVLPSFFADTRRSIKGTDYFFIDQKMLYLDENESIESLALCCRLVKNTTLKRHQIYTPNEGIVSSERTLKSAPSSIAVLLLHSHRLLFVREVPGAPSIHQFGTTFKHRMRDEVLNLQAALYDKYRTSGEKVTRKKIKKLFPVPDVDVTPLTSSEALRTFIDRFAVLTTLKVGLAPTNNELDNEEFFEDAREAQELVGGVKTILTHTNPKGLDKEGCIEHVEAAKQGNLQVEMRGKDQHGDDIKGDNSDFSVRASLGTSEVRFDDGVINAYNRYQNLKEEEVVSEGPQLHDYAQKLRDAFRSLS